MFLQGKTLTESERQSIILRVVQRALEPILDPVGKDSLSAALRSSNGKCVVLAAQEVNQVRLQPLTGILGTFRGVEADMIVEGGLGRS